MGFPCLCPCSSVRLLRTYIIAEIKIFLANYFFVWVQILLCSFTLSLSLCICVSLMHYAEERMPNDRTGIMLNE